MKWSPCPAVSTKKYQVKVKLMKLEGSIIDGLVMVEMKWKGPKSGLGYLRRKSKKKCRNLSEKIRVGGGFWAIDLGDEFENVCGFSSFPKDNKSNAWEICFRVLYGGQSEEAKSKLSKIGRSSLSIAELARQMQNKKSGFQIEREIAISLQIDGVATSATLSISISFSEIRTSQELAETVHSTANAIEKDGSFLRRWVDVTNYLSQSNGPEEAEEMTDESSARPPLSSTDFTIDNGEDELINKDRHEKLKAYSFSSSADQCSQSATRESACTDLVGVIAYWVHSYRNSMPNRLGPEYFYCSYYAFTFVLIIIMTFALNRYL